MRDGNASTDPRASAVLATTKADAADTSTGRAHGTSLHETLLKELLHDIGIALAQLRTDGLGSSAVHQRLLSRRDDVYAQLAALED